MSKVLSASQVAQWQRIHLPMQELQETRVRSLSQQDSLEEEMATSSSIFARIIPWTEEPGEMQSMGLQRIGHNWVVEYVCVYKSAPHKAEHY